MHRRRTRLSANRGGYADGLASQESDSHTTVRAFTGVSNVPVKPCTTPFPLYFFMGFIWMLIIGLVVGAIAKFLTPGRDPGGCVITMLIGIAGALAAGFLGRGLGWYVEGEPVGFIASVVGAILLLLLYRFVTKDKAA